MRKHNHSVFQEIIFPDPEFVGDSGLYYRSTGIGLYFEQGSSGQDSSEQSRHVVMKGTYVDFHTYFNSFSCNKWNRYTSVNNVSLFLEMEGRAVVYIFHNLFLYGQVVEKNIGRHTVISETRQLVEIPIGIMDNLGDYSFGIQAGEESVAIYGGYYGCRDFVRRQEVSLAVCFTTYKREEYIKRNLAGLCSASNVNMHIYVVDNGKTLNLPDSDRYTVIPNKNTGGAGGFARNMFHVMDDAINYGFTHFILMDDDIVLDPKVIARLSDFLGYVKDEYRNSFVGGAMLRKDIPYFLVESGAVCKGLKIQGYGYGMDMRNPENFMQADMSRKTDYSAWWFCVIPIEYARSDNLPLPIFFQWDDIDFGLRNKAQVILLNGISVWHDSFEAKRTVMHSYYTARNPMIVNACHENCVEKPDVLSFIKENFVTELYLYRYANAEAILRAVEDFLKGPGWLAKLDFDAYNKEIMAENYKQEYIYELDYTWFQVCCNMEDCDWIHALARKITFNGYLLPTKNFVAVPCYNDKIVQGYRASKILFYDEVSGKGYYCARDVKRARACYVKYKRLMKRLKGDFNRLKKEYKSSYAYLTSREMWENVFG